MMMKLLALLCVLVACQAMSLEDPTASLYGEYKLIYSWPKLGKDIPNCSPVHISEADASSSTCKCGRSTANPGLFTVESRERKFTVLADLVTSEDELKQALGDKCSCDNGSFDHSVVRRYSGGFLLQLDTNISKGFLIGRSPPTADQLEAIIAGLPFDSEHGSLVCQ